MPYSTPRYVFGSQLVRLAAFTLAVILGNAQADPVSFYSVTPITGFTPSSYSSALNDLGQVAGTTGSLAAIWINGAVTILGTLPGYSSSSASGINDSGQVTGSSGGKAFLYSNGAMINLNIAFPPGNPGGSASGINNSGQVTGGSTFGRPMAFLYSNGVATYLGAPPFALGSFGTAINDSGQVTGWAVEPETVGTPWVYKNGVMTAIANFPGGGSDINNAGQITFTSSGNFGGPGRAFLYNNGVITFLGTLPGQTFSSANAINDSGEIVGASGHAWVYINGTMIDLNSLIDPSLNINLTDARAINNSGQILATGNAGTSYLLRPVPEPGAWPLCVGGLLAVAAVRLQRKQADPITTSGK